MYLSYGYLGKEAIFDCWRLNVPSALHCELIIISKLTSTLPLMYLSYVISTYLKVHTKSNMLVIN